LEEGEASLERGRRARASPPKLEVWEEERRQRKAESAKNYKRVLHYIVYNVVQYVLRGPVAVKKALPPLQSPRGEK
jgi:hypothetical protein